MNLNDERLSHAASEAATAAAAKATYAGGALSAVGGLALSNEAVALIGLVLAGAGWLTQVYFSVRRDRREAEEHELRMQEIRRRAAGSGK